MKRYVVVGGAKIENYDYVKSHVREDDFVVYCDCGLKHMDKLGLQPNLVIGDWDSHAKPDIDVEMITLPHVKDDTDTAYAVKEGIRRGFYEFMLLGVIGQRFDHTLGNMQLLNMLDSSGKRGLIVDDYSEMTVVSARSGEALISDEFPYFSLINISGLAKGIKISGAMYNLSDAELDCDWPLGVSNEVLKGEVARVSVKEGRVLLIKVRYE